MAGTQQSKGNQEDFWAFYRRTGRPPPYRRFIADAPPGSSAARPQIDPAYLGPKAPIMSTEETEFLRDVRSLLEKSDQARRILAVTDARHVDTFIGDFSKSMNANRVMGEYQSSVRSTSIDRNFGFKTAPPLDHPNAKPTAAWIYIHEHWHGVQDCQNLSGDRAVRTGPTYPDGRRSLTLTDSVNGLMPYARLKSAIHHEASALAMQMEVGWQLKKAGEPDVWRVMQTAGLKHPLTLMARDYERAVALDPRAEFDGQARRAAHDRAVLEMPDSVLAKTISGMRRDVELLHRALPADGVPTKVNAHFKPDHDAIRHNMEQMGNTGINTGKEGNHLMLDGYPPPTDFQYQLKLSPEAKRLVDAIGDYNRRIIGVFPRAKAFQEIMEAGAAFDRSGATVRATTVAAQRNADDSDTVIRSPLLGDMTPEPEILQPGSLKHWRENKLEALVEAAKTGKQTTTAPTRRRAI
ncbi:MAG: hypothetical protein AAF556_07460 [Pseudomonadota bacterium]